MQNNRDSVTQGACAPTPRHLRHWAMPKGCIWSNFWRNGATQKWRHRVFCIVLQRISAFAGMPGRGGTMKA
jgi:hypothetical protein